ncbi:MAG: hypothetical protein ACP6IY_12185 [Promethearchaeia archaeon]
MEEQCRLKYGYEIQQNWSKYNWKSWKLTIGDKKMTVIYVKKNKSNIKFYNIFPAIFSYVFQYYDINLRRSGCSKHWKKYRSYLKIDSSALNSEIDVLEKFSQCLFLIKEVKNFVKYLFENYYELKSRVTV